ncbi:hypothetical protein I546_0579 [Mycobacterium kansasii 732]|nr:hypothetical protein I546_0579 [Mycobacterium kansasii 732]
MRSPDHRAIAATARTPFATQDAVQIDHRQLQSGYAGLLT